MKAKRAGYSLIELMLVVALAGILGALAINQFNSYISRSKRAEALFGLAALQAAQGVYFIENQRYAGSFDEITFVVAGGARASGTEYRGKRYTYNISQPWGAKSWYATATADLDGDPWPDVLAVWDLKE